MGIQKIANRMQFLNANIQLSESNNLKSQKSCRKKNPNNMFSFKDTFSFKNSYLTKLKLKRSHKFRKANWLYTELFFSLVAFLFCLLQFHAINNFNIKEKDAPKPKYKFGYSNSKWLQLTWQRHIFNGNGKIFFWISIGWSCRHFMLRAPVRQKLCTKYSP